MNSSVSHQRNFPRYGLIVLVHCLGIFAQCGAADKDPNTLPKYIAADPRPFIRPRAYVCQRSDGPITIDGKLDEPAWQQAARTEAVVDIEGSMRPVTPRHDTSARMLWDDKRWGDLPCQSSLGQW